MSRPSSLTDFSFDLVMSLCCYYVFGSVSVSEYDSLSVIIYLQIYNTIIHSHLHMHLSACNFTSPLCTYYPRYARHATFHCLPRYPRFNVSGQLTVQLFCSAPDALCCAISVTLPSPDFEARLWESTLEVHLSTESCLLFKN